MKKSFILLIFIIFLINHCFSQSPDEILIGTNNKINSLSSYRLEYSSIIFMPPMNPDTLYANATVYSKKATSDTLIGINYFIESNRTDYGTSIAYYNTNESYSSNKGNIKSGANYFSMSVAGKVGLDFYFKTKNFLIKNLLIPDEAFSLKLLHDTLIANNLTYHIKGTFTDKNMINPLSCVLEKRNTLKVKKGLNTEIDLFISKQDSLPIQSIYKRYLNNDLEMYVKSDILKAEINLTEHYTIPDDFNFVENKTPVNPFQTNIDSSWQPANFCLLNQDSINVCLNSINSNKILIVFGTKGCGGCVKLQPELNSFYKKQDKNDLSILYITLFKNPSLLKMYKAKYKLDFEMLLGNKEIWKEYKIKGFPTLLLLDRNKKLVKTQLGSMSSSELETFTKL